MKKILPILALILVIAFVGIFEWNSMASETTKHFDNGIVAFDYPANLNVDINNSKLWKIDVNDGWYVSCIIELRDYPYNTSNYTFDKYFKNNYYVGEIIEANKTTISGKPAYNLTTKGPGGQIIYGTYIDTGNGIIFIGPYDNGDAANYNVYKTIVNSFQIK